MKKLLLLAILLIGCSKDEEVIQQFDCECENLEVYDPNSPTYVRINIRPCNVDSELDGADRATYLKEFRDLPLEFALEIAKKQGCKN